MLRLLAVFLFLSFPFASAALSADIDDTITNKLLRAESGSKSKWSIASTFTYEGATVRGPLAEDRPNIAKSSGTIPKSLLEGQVSAKYNVSVKQSVMLGLGVRWIAPLTDHSLSDYSEPRFDTDNPYLTYQYVYNWLGLQSVLQAQQTYYTNSNLTNEGYVTSLNIDQESMFEIPNSPLSVGFSLAVQLAYYDKSGPVGELTDVRSDQSDYSLSFDPVLEYQLNLWLNFRSVTDLWNFEHLRSAPRADTFQCDRVVQSIGFGLSLNRDIFLYPNIQFLLDNIRADQTNVAITATINL